MTDGDGLTRRQLLAAAAATVGVSRLSGEGPTGGAGGVESWSAQRSEPLRPAPGGAVISDGGTRSATLAGGFETTEGDPRFLTARHVLDPEFCGGSDDQVLGVDVYQPTDADDPIGAVVDVGRDNGADATDWAAIEPADPSEWTPYIAGVGFPQGTVEPQLGQRIVLSGARTGLIGGEVIGTSAAKVFLGCQFFDLVQYTVDEDADTNGNSGGLVGVFDDANEFQLLGVHVFGDDDGRYALPIGDVLNNAGLTVASTGDLPTDSDAPGFLETAVAHYDESAEELVAVVGNTGGGQRSGDVRTVKDGETVGEASVDLSPFTEGFVTLSTGGYESVDLDTGDVVRTITL